MCNHDITPISVYTLHINREYTEMHVHHHQIFLSLIKEKAVKNNRWS